MEEAPVVDCPPTPEILPLSSTPPPRSDVLCSSSSEEGDEPTDGRRSPPPKCAICLGKCRQRAYTNSCKHQFCFRCLLEWSKVKPECPLCKQRFFSIVYYKSIDCFEQHTVAVPAANVPRVSTRNMYHDLSVFLSNSQRFTAYAIPNMTLRLQSNNERLQELLLHQSSEVDRFISEYGNQPIPTRQDELRWRQFIYTNRLYACPLPDLNGRFRETSASFYRDNPGQMHRVLSWMHRDLLVLSSNIAIHAPNMGVLEDLLQMHDIDSREFLLRILRHMPLEDGEQFQHECANFARSPYDMIGYDRCVQYNPRFIQHRVRSQVVISSSEEDNDDIVYLPEPAAGTSSNNEAPAVEGSVGGEGVSNGSSTASGEITGTSSNSTATSGTLNARNGRSVVNNEFNLLIDSVGNIVDRPVAMAGSLPRVPLTSTIEASENISLSSSDSDDCQFVMAQKPPHLRTPDHVVDLESASDSDVVFIAEEPVEPHATNRTTRQQQQANSLKKETAGIQEYNNGASTSSGYCGAGNGGGASSGSVASGSALRSKYYVRTPRSNRYTGGTGVKSIYEASDTDDSDSDTLFNLPHGRRPTSNTANDSSSHEEIDVGRGQRNRRRLNKKTSTTIPKGSKRASRKRRNVSVSSSSSEDCSASSSSDEANDSDSSHSSCSSSSSNSCSSSSSSSSSSSGSISSSYDYGGRGSTTYHKNVQVEIECGRQLRRNTAAQSRAIYSARSKSAETDSKGRTKKKRSRRTIEKESKQAKEKVATTASKSKSRHTKSKKKSQSSSRAVRDVTKGSRTKSKSRSRGVTARNNKGKKRTKSSFDPEDDPSRSTPLLDEDMHEENASTRAHYVIASRPSVSPTVDVTSVDGTECGQRKLKSVIIKRCHYNKSTVNRPNEATNIDEGMQSGSGASTTAMPDCVEPSTSNSFQGEERVPESVNFGKMEPVDVTDMLKCEPVANDVQLSFSSNSSSESEPEPPSATDWADSRMYSAVASLVQMHRNALLHPTSLVQQPQQEQHNQQHAQQNWQQPEEYIQEQLQLPINDNDQHPQTLGSNDAMLHADESNTGASESIFEPTLSWAETGRPLLPEDRALSSAAASPFSSISFPPSTTSVSPSPSMSSQSLALAAAASPLQLIESLGTMDGDSPLPSSVLGIDAIDSTMDEIMATEVVGASATIAEPPIGMDQETADGSAIPCELAPTTSDAVPAVQLQL
ncbi:E3 ubiquitin-protein ligase Topors-like [Anopheles marshallii]|uniref:E3 ubiquitin-protein ligase Topors-like n=1 Tax=Anopheles marshallii TaxID=1521116 RepID=UPI00237C1D5D|nr:E3 ubiquitin-protein ligase Topors-like [Anopheles marshallii]